MVISWKIKSFFSLYYGSRCNFDLGKKNVLIWWSRREPSQTQYVIIIIIAFVWLDYNNFLDLLIIIYRPRISEIYWSQREYARERQTLKLGTFSKSYTPRHNEELEGNRGQGKKHLFIIVNQSTYKKK